jgi:hypothetical protein
MCISLAFCRKQIRRCARGEKISFREVSDRNLTVYRSFAVDNGESWAGMKASATFKSKIITPSTAEAGQ